MGPRRQRREQGAGRGVVVAHRVGPVAELGDAPAEAAREGIRPPGARDQRREGALRTEAPVQARRMPHLTIGPRVRGRIGHEIDRADHRPDRRGKTREGEAQDDVPGGVAGDEDRPARTARVRADDRAPDHRAGPLRGAHVGAHGSRVERDLEPRGRSRGRIGALELAHPPSVVHRGPDNGVGPRGQPVAPVALTRAAHAEHQEGVGRAHERVGAVGAVLGDGIRGIALGGRGLRRSHQGRRGGGDQQRERKSDARLSSAPPPHGS